MKNIKKCFCIMLSLCLLFLGAVPAFAAESEYTYVIRFFSGKQGTFGGEEVLVFDNLHYGDQINFYQSAVTLHDNSKYYIRGVRESGKDNSETEQRASFTVTGDQDYVIAYGILGDMTSYTINYEDQNGNALAPSETYYGNVGDKPVIAYLYIDGYRPQAYNLTKTLAKDASENVFTFVYTRVATGGTGGGGTGGTGGGTGGTENAGGETQPAEAENVAATQGAGDGVVIVPGGGVAAGGVAAGDGAGGAAAGDGAGAAGDNENLVNAPDEEVPQTQDLVDLDDEDVPLSKPSILEIGNEATLLGIPVPAIAVAGIILLGVGYFIIAKRRKKAEEE